MYGLRASRARRELAFATSVPGSITFRMWVKCIPQSVTGEIERQQSEHEHTCGKDDHPPVRAQGINLRGAFRNERAQAGLRGLDAETKITEERFVKDNSRNSERDR